MKASSKLLFVSLVLATLLAACAKIDTGIQGKVMLATCTGQEVATGCTGTLPYQAKLDIYDKNVKKIETVSTKSDGTFVIALAPGLYFIHPVNSGSYPIAADFRVSVSAGKLTEMTIYYDTGVR